MPPIISISNLTKTYASGFQALNGIDQGGATVISLRR
jgi:hypothetical protein